MIRLYHRTTSVAAEKILADGFHERSGDPWGGCFLSNEPLTVNEGAKGDALLEVMLDMTTAALFEYEMIEEGKPYREFIIPADVLNSKGRVRIMADGEEDAIEPGDIWNEYPPGEPERTLAELAAEDELDPL